MELTKDNIIVQRPYKTVYRCGDTVVKIFSKDHPKTGVFNEALITAYVETTGLPIPAVKSVDCIDGCWALTIERADGRTLEAKMAEEPEKRTEYLEKFVDIQLRVNSFKATHLRNTRDKMEEEINSLKNLDPSTRYELLQRLHGMPRHTKLCHGDFVPSNILIADDGSYKIIDWAHATQGNAGADAAISYMRFCLTDPSMAEEYLKIFSKKSDTAIQYMQKWMPIVAAAQLTKGVPEEKELLEQWISVAEYE